MNPEQLSNIGSSPTGLPRFSLQRLSSLAKGGARGDLASRCGDALTDLRGDLLDEGPQRLGVGRRDEEEGGEADVKREMRQKLCPVVGRTDVDCLVAVANGAGAEGVNAPDML